MAITTTERTKLIELFVLMFDAAPGASFLSAITDVFEATGHSFQQTANVLGSTLAYQTLHPNFEQPDEFAYKLLSEVGLQ
ncbi:MAG TPA: hypothetical protein VHA82_00605, partial [Ramlibacter sp.]|uniref:hypothetical protein n=1 Tax=Ramlibacter sp. TaxID=1917967 RepID=UPI002B9FCCF6